MSVTTRSIIIAWLSIRENYDKLPVIEIKDKSAPALLEFAKGYNVGYEQFVYVMNDHYFLIKIIE